MRRHRWMAATVRGKASASRAALLAVLQGKERLTHVKSGDFLVTDMHGPLINDPHDDRSPACNPKGAFNLEYERWVLILRGHDLILPSLVPDR